MNDAPDRADSPSASPLFWIALAVALVAAVLLVYYPVIANGPFVEMDFIWLSAGKAGADWLPYLDHLRDLFEKPVMRPVQNARPGAWILHVLIGRVFGDSPRAVMSIISLILAINSLFVGVITWSLFRSRRASVGAAFLFALHPQLSGSASLVTSLAPQVSILWMMVSLLSLLRYKQIGHVFQLVPMMCGVFLSYSTHNLGLAVIPAILFLDLATLSSGGKRGRLLGVIGRQFLVIIPLLFFLMMWIPTDGATDLIRIYVAFRMVKPMFMALAEGLNRMLLPIPQQMEFSDLIGGVDIGHFLIFLLPVLLGIGMAGVFQNRKRIFGLMMIIAGLLIQVPNLMTLHSSSPGYSVPFLVSVVGLAVLLGEWLTRIPPKSAGILAVFALVCFYGTSASINARHWAEQGKAVGTMADQLAAVYNDLSDTADIFIVGAGRHTSTMLAAHLDFIRRNGLDKRTRFSFIQNGRLTVGTDQNPIGESARGATRLVYDSSMTFVGYSDKKGLVDLTPLIAEKVKQANAVLKSDKVLPPRWRFGREQNIQNWNPLPEVSEQIPIETTDGLVWYVEGQIENLHPQVGRHLF